MVARRKSSSHPVAGHSACKSPFASRKPVAMSALTAEKVFISGFTAISRDIERESNPIRRAWLSERLYEDVYLPALEEAAFAIWDQMHLDSAVPREKLLSKALLYLENPDVSIMLKSVLVAKKLKAKAQELISKCGTDKNLEAIVSTDKGIYERLLEKWLESFETMLEFDPSTLGKDSS